MNSVNCSQLSAQCLPYISECKTLELHQAEFHHDILHIPTDVDCWLTANLQCSQNVLFCWTISNLEMLMMTLWCAKLRELQFRYIYLNFCTLLQSSNTMFSCQNPACTLSHTLFITVTAKSTKHLPLNVWASPWAVLDYYQEDVNNINSPDWVWSEKTQYIFVQPHMTFASLFVCLACCNFNSNQVWTPFSLTWLNTYCNSFLESWQWGLDHHMMEWAHSIIVSLQIIFNSCVLSMTLVYLGWVLANPSARSIDTQQSAHCEKPPVS